MQAHQSPPKVTVAELLQQLTVTQAELENVKVRYYVHLTYRFGSFVEYIMNTQGRFNTAVKQTTDCLISCSLQDDIGINAFL